MPEHLKKISEEIIHENPWFTYKHDKYRQADDKEHDYYYLETNGMAMVIPVREDGRIVLVLQHRYLEEKQSIEFPGGGVKKGMDPIDAAREELLEETGWVSEEMTKIGSFGTANGLAKEMAHVYVTHVTEQYEQQLEGTEDIEVIYRRPDEIMDMIQRGDIWCGQTLASWALAQNYFVASGSSETSNGLKVLFDYFLGEE